MGARGRVAGGGRDPAHLDGPRWHSRRLRLRADGGGVIGGVDPGDRVGWCGNVRPLRRRLHTRARGCGARRLRVPLLRTLHRGTQTSPDRLWHSYPPRMLIPSIDLQGGRIVQLVQGERLALVSDDIDGWIARFRGRPKVQLIDLDAAKDEGSNATLVRRICAALPCRVGGGVRTVARARDLLDGGATHVIVGSAFFKGDAVD